MKLGILGTGHVATTLAPAWAKAGHQVTLGASPAQIGPSSVFLSGNSANAKSQTDQRELRHADPTPPHEK